MNTKNPKTSASTKNKVSRAKGAKPVDAETLLKLLLASELDEPLPIDEWQDALMWRPSQCYYHTQKDGVDYVLNLSWGWKAPWQGYIFKNAKTEKDLFRTEAERSPDLFEEKGLFFKADQLGEAKSKLLELFTHLTSTPSGKDS